MYLEFNNMGYSDFEFCDIEYSDFEHDREYVQVHRIK